MNKADIKKVVLAYSGGLDTSVILKWLSNFSDKHGIKFTIAISDEPDLAPEGIRQYF